MVVDGLITDEAPPYIIKLSYSGNLSRSLLIPDELTINGAVVSVDDNLGNRALLEQDPLTPAFYWLRDSRLRGVAGRSYTLRVSLPDGSQYVSRPERLAPVPPLERIYGEYHEAGPTPGEFSSFRVRLDTQDPPSRGNFYRWQGLCYMPFWVGGDPNGYYKPGEGSYVPFYGPLSDVLSDQLINGNHIAGRLVLTTPILALGPQYVEVRQYSLSREAYQYWVLYQEQLSRTGSLFDPQPSSIEGNVHALGDTTKLALGYFGASAVSRQRIIMTNDSLNYSRFVTRFGPYLFDGRPLIIPGLALQEREATAPPKWLTYGK